MGFHEYKVVLYRNHPEGWVPESVWGGIPIPRAVYNRPLPCQMERRLETGARLEKPPHICLS